MKKLVSVLLAIMVILSAFSGISLSAFAESDAQTLKVTVGDVTVEIPVGEKFIYKYTLTDVDILNIEAMVNYNSSLMSLTVEDDSDDEVYEAFMKETFPLVYACAVWNPNLSNVIYYNFSTVSGKEFVGEQTLASFEFTALCAGEATISTEVIEMVGADKEYYVDKTVDGSVLVKEYTYAEYIDYEAPVVPTEPETEESTEPESSSDQPATEEPTEEPTEAETEEPTEEETEPTPVKVENITYSATATTAKLTWGLLDSANKYWVYQYSEKYGVWTSVVSAYTNEAVVKGLAGDTTYKFKVIARIGDNTYLSLDDADAIEVTTEKAVATDGITATTGIVSAELSWEPIEGAVKYWVYKSTSESGPYYIYTSVTNATSCTVKRLRPDTTYYFKVTALTYENEIECYSKVDDSPMVTVNTGSASVITTELVSNTATDATISWPAFENAEKYWIRYSTTSSDIYDSSHWTTLTSTTDTTYTLGLTPNTVYYLNVCAKYTVDGAVATIDYIPVMVRTAYQSGDIITFTPVDETTVTLSWDAVDDITKTWVYTVADDGTETMLASTTENTVTVTLADYTNATFALKVLDTQDRYGYLTPTGGEKYHE